MSPTNSFFFFLLSLPPNLFIATWIAASKPTRVTIATKLPIKTFPFLVISVLPSDVSLNVPSSSSIITPRLIAMSIRPLPRSLMVSPSLISSSLSFFMANIATTISASITPNSIKPPTAFLASIIDRTANEPAMIRIE